MINLEKFQKLILEELSNVTDPETGEDIVRMHLIEDLVVDENGHVTYKFRPSRSLVPIIVPLSMAIQKVVGKVDGVTGQDLEVVGYLDLKI